MKKRLVSLVLLASMVMGLSGCAGKGYSDKKLVKYAEKELNLEEIDAKKAQKKINNMKKQDYYFYADAKETKKLLWESIEIDDYFAKPKGVESSVAVITGEPNELVELAIIITFDSSDNAIKFMEKSADFWDEDVEWEDYYIDKNNEVMAGYYEDPYGLNLIAGAYQKGNTVLLVIGASDDDFETIEGVCEEFNVEYVEDLL